MRFSRLERRPDAKVRPRLRPVIEPEHGLHDAVQIVRHADRAGAAAELARRVMLVMFQLDAERGLELRDRAAQQHLARRRIFPHHRQAVCGGKGFDLGDVVRRGAVIFGKRLARQRFDARVARFDLAHQRVELRLPLTAQYHENFDPFCRIALPNDCRTLFCRSLASWQRLSVDHGVDSPVSVTARAARWTPGTARVCTNSPPGDQRRVAVSRTSPNRPTNAFEHSSGVRGSCPNG